jgi:hypothetical protein
MPPSDVPPLDEGFFTDWTMALPRTFWCLSSAAAPRGRLHRTAAEAATTAWFAHRCFKTTYLELDCVDWFLLEEQTRRLLMRNRSAVRAVAHALRERGALSGDDIRRIVDGTRLEDR